MRRSAAPSPPTGEQPVQRPKTEAGRDAKGDVEEAEVQNSDQNSLVQHLAALHVGRLDVDAVSATLPGATSTARWLLTPRHPPARLDGRSLHLHVSETLDAEKGLVLRREENVGLLVQDCKKMKPFTLEEVEHKTRCRSSYSTSCVWLWCVWPWTRCRGGRTSWPGE